MLYVSCISIKNAKKTIYFSSLLLDIPIDLLKRPTMLDDKRLYLDNEKNSQLLEIFVSLALAILLLMHPSL